MAGLRKPLIEESGDEKQSADSVSFHIVAQGAISDLAVELPVHIRLAEHTVGCRIFALRALMPEREWRPGDVSDGSAKRNLQRDVPVAEHGQCLVECTHIDQSASAQKHSDGRYAICQEQVEERQAFEGRRHRFAREFDDARLFYALDNDVRANRYSELLGPRVEPGDGLFEEFGRPGVIIIMDDDKFAPGLLQGRVARGLHAQGVSIVNDLQPSAQRDPVVLDEIVHFTRTAAVIDDDGLPILVRLVENVVESACQQKGTLFRPDQYGDAR